MAQDNYGLLLAALVAIVAVVGLVILFSNASSSGAPTIGQPGETYCSCPAGQEPYLYAKHMQYGAGTRCGCRTPMADRVLWPR